jgi:hypothetical protein
MRKFTLCFLSCILLGAFTHLQAQTGVIRIVVLGSSTAAGSGPSDINNAWVNRYRQYVKSINPSSEVINLAVGGYTTYHTMPSDFTAPDGRPSPDTDHNITKALSLSPNVIIVNLPTNDAANGYSIPEQMYNYNTLINQAIANGIPIYIATTQPRNLSAELRDNLISMRDTINKYLGNNAIDFWTDIANDDGTINSSYDIGDGVHLNDAAHLILKDRVVAKDILDHSQSDNDRDTIYIDLGTNISTGNYNNIAEFKTGAVANMVNSLGQNSGISISIHDAFTGVNTAGTTSADAAVDFVSTATSDSFFGSEGDHSGVTEPTGGFTLTGLNRNSLYSITFFASRMNTSDNRETKYKVVGVEKDSVNLNPANNTSNVVTISNIKPTDNGTITIEVSPGPNNTNEKKYYFIGAMRIIGEKQEVEYDTNGTVQVDFGSNLSTGTWNNLMQARGGETITDMVNSEGNSTGMSIWIHDAFTGINTAGTTTPDESLGLSANASADSFFGSEGEHSGVKEPTGGVTIAGLDQNSKYTLTFFASRMETSDNREAKYVVTGSTETTVTLDAANNTSNAVSVEAIRPNADGIITVAVSPGPNNSNSLKYYYLGAMLIDYWVQPVGITNPTASSGNLINSVYPNPFKDVVNIDYQIPQAGNVQVTIYNLIGQVEQVVVNTYQTEGTYSAKWIPSSKKSGIYLCQIKVVSANKTYTNTKKIVSGR